MTPVRNIRVSLVADPGLIGGAEVFALVTAVGWAGGVLLGVWLAGLL